MTTERTRAEAKVQIDNERVVVTEWRFIPGAETGWHRHAYDYIVIPENNGSLLLESADGENLSELEAGQSYFRPAGIEHNVINMNDYEFAFVEVELK